LKIVGFSFFSVFAGAMFIRIKEKSNGHRAIQIVQTVREGERVRQKLVRHVGHAKNDEEVQAYQEIATSILNSLDPQLSFPLAKSPRVEPGLDCDFDNRVRIRDLREDRRVIEGIQAVFGNLYDELGFSKLLKPDRSDSKCDVILRDLVLARLADPLSKRKSVQMLWRNFNIHHSLDPVYRMMDKVTAHQAEIRDTVCNATLGLFQKGIDVLFFDVTTLFFESFSADELRNFGFSKDCKFKQTQVVLALVTTTGGMPITYELFPGNKFEGHTLLPIIELLKKRFEVHNILLVADRAMFTKENLKAMDDQGIGYIVGAKLRKLPPTLRSQILEERGYYPSVVEDELHWVGEFEHEGRRLITSYSSIRARKDQSDRLRLIERLKKKSRGRDTLPIGEIINNAGTAKFLEIEKASAKIDEKKITSDAQWDGMHGIITNVKTQSAISLLSRYRGLWQIEDAFRIKKNDLAMRPIFHWTENRIRAHVAICFLAYAIAKHATSKLQVSGLNLSFARLREELLLVQASILVNIRTRKFYRVPSKLTDLQAKIFKIFRLRRSDVPDLCARQ